MMARPVAPAFITEMTRGPRRIFHIVRSLKGGVETWLMPVNAATDASAEREGSMFKMITSIRDKAVIYGA